MIDKVNWDSEFFGYPVGICRIGNKGLIDELAFRKAAAPYRLVYIFSDIELSHPIGQYVDKKVVLTKFIEKANVDDTITHFNLEQHSYEQLLELAYLSGVFSRFRIDKSFVNHEFERMYKIWLDNSLSGKIAKHTLVATIHNELAGFITLDIKPMALAHIGLVAVSEKHQGKGIGGKLLAAADFYAAKEGCKTIEVPTQYDNEPAMRLYQKHGYSIQSITCIYHYWNI